MSAKDIANITKLPLDNVIADLDEMLNERYHVNNARIFDNMKFDINTHEIVFDTQCNRCSAQLNL